MAKARAAAGLAAGIAGRAHTAHGEVESTYAWMRLIASLAISSIGGVGMWSVAVVLPAVQAEFGVARSAASLPYTLTMLGFGFGGILMGRLSDRFGIVVPVVVGAIALALGFFAAGAATSLWQFAAAQGLLIGLLGSSASFGPPWPTPALVHALARHRGRDLRERQLSRRRDLAADHPALRRDRRLAPGLLRPRRRLRGDDAAARTRAAPSPAGPRTHAGRRAHRDVV
jgi:hypothetical protein